MDGALGAPDRANDLLEQVELDPSLQRGLPTAGEANARRAQEEEERLALKRQIARVIARDLGIGASRRIAAAALVPGDPLSAMSPQFNLFFRWFAHRFFRHIGLDAATVAGTPSVHATTRAICRSRASRSSSSCARRA